MKEIKLTDNKPCKSTYHKKLVDQNSFASAAAGEEDNKKNKMMTRKKWVYNELEAQSIKSFEMN